MHAGLNEERSVPVSKDSAKIEKIKVVPIDLQFFFKKSVENPSGPGDLADCIEDMSVTISSLVIGVSRSAHRSLGREGIPRLSKKSFKTVSFAVLSEVNKDRSIEVYI